MTIQNYDKILDWKLIPKFKHTLPFFVHVTKHQNPALPGFNGKSYKFLSAPDEITVT
jgi:hypothetical protein